MYLASTCELKGKTKTPAGQAEGMRPRRSESEVWHVNQQRCKKQCILASLFN